MKRALALAGLLLGFASVAHARVVVDAAKAPTRKTWAEKTLAPVLEREEATVTRLLDGPDAAVSAEPLTLVLEKEGAVPAWSLAERRVIHLNLAWADNATNEVAGALVHELAHLVQRYPAKKGPPGWLTEGVADWVRWFNYEPKEARESRRKLALRDRRHNAGYVATAAFLDWIVKTYDREIVRKLNLLCRAGEYRGATTWKDLLYKTQEQLANEYRASLLPREKPVGAMDIATYNVRRSGDKGEKDWRVRFPQLLGVIAARRLEIIGFQEVNPDQLSDLKSGLYGWEEVGLGREADHRGEASPIFYRADRFEKRAGGMFWLSETPDKPGSLGWDAKYPRVCSWVTLHDRVTGKDFAYFNCHTDHKSIKARQEGVRLILRKMAELAPGLPTVLGGDFNDEIVGDKLREEIEKKDGTHLTPRGPEHPIALVREKMKDTYDITETPHVGSYWTDNGYGKKHVKRIDYLFVTEGVRVLTHETTCDRPDNLYPSDHESVVARLILP